MRYTVKFDRGFLLLCLFLVLINMPLLFKLVVPIHDTGQSFRNFYFFYNDLFNNSEIPQWLPFGAYGIQSGMFFSMVPAACFITGAAGLIFRVEDALILYNLGLLLEQLLMLTGAYRLARLLFKNDTTVYFVCLSVMGATVLITQVYLNFFMVYLIPYITYYVLRFFIEKRPSMLAKGLILSLLLFQGLVSYAVVIPALAVSCIFVVLLIAHCQNLKGFLSISRREVLQTLGLFFLFIVILWSYYTYLEGSMQGLSLLSANRNPDYSVRLDTFLAYPRTISPDKFAGLVTPLELAEKDWNAFESTVFFGLVPLLFAAYALVRVRIPVIYALMSASVVLGFLALGSLTPIAEWLYNWFPMMKYYRHISYVIGVWKVLLPFVAGYGLDRVLSEPEKHNLITSKISISVMCGIVLAECLFMLYLLGISPQGERIDVFMVMVYLLPIIIAITAFTLLRRSTRRLAIMLLVFVVLEAIAYQSAIYYKVRVLTNDVAAYMKSSYEEIVATTYTHPYGYIESRTYGLNNPRENAARAYVTVGSSYNFDYNYIQTDPCVQMYRLEIIGQKADNLMKTWNSSMSWTKNDMEAIGCNSPKLKIYTQVDFADRYTNNLAGNLVGIGKYPVIEDVPIDLMTRNHGGYGTAEIVQFTPNKIDITATVQSTEGAWLYYADSWHPNWKAYVNGTPTQVYISNIAFKAIHLPQGDSIVVLKYEDYRERLFQYFLIAIGATLTLLFILDFGSSRNRVGGFISL